MEVKTGCMKWYIYKEDANNYGLILDHNTTTAVQWITGNDYHNANTDGTACPTSACNDEGPITLMNKLKEDTTDQGWKVDADVITIDDVMNLIPWYQKLTDKTDWKNQYTEVASNASQTVMTTIMENFDNYSNVLDAYKDAAILMRNDYSEIILPDFMYKDLLNTITCDESAVCTTNGYWTKSPVDGKDNDAWDVFMLGNTIGNDVTGIDARSGLKPVITLSKSIF